MDYDAIVVGGGTAGLQAALTLGRMRFDVVVIDGGAPSNAPAHAIGGLLGAHDLSPLEFLANGRKQLAELPSVRIIDGEATRVDADLSVTLADGTALAARAIVLATGADYQRPDVQGMSDMWGDTVIHCPFCHGWEARDSRIGLLAESDEHAEHVFPMLSGLSADVEVFREVERVEASDGKLRAVVLPDGTEVERDVLFIAAPPKPRDASFAHLGIPRLGPGLLEVDDFGSTQVAGVYAAGDLIAQSPSVAQAISTGQKAAVAVTRALAGERQQ